MLRLACKIILLLMLVGIAEAQYVSAIVTTNRTSGKTFQVAIDASNRVHQLPSTIWTNVVVWQPSDEAYWDSDTLFFRGISKILGPAAAKFYTSTASTRPSFSTANGGVHVFGGTDDFMAKSAGASQTGNLTLLIWAKVTTWVNYAGMIAGQPQSGTTWNGMGYGLVHASTADYRTYFMLGNSATTGVGSGSPAGTSGSTVGMWRFHAGTVSGTAMAYYINGVRQSTNTFTGSRQTSANMGIGYVPNVGKYLIGSLDDGMVINRALTSNEVYSIWLRTKGTYGL